MKVAVAGASGLIGSALVPALRGRGDTVLRLVRHTPQAPDEVEWHPEAGILDPASLDDVDVIVNLAGAGVGDRRWSAEYKREIRHSRVDATRTVARTVAMLDRRPALVNASAIGFYGDTGDRAVDESDPAGTGFLPEVVQAWELAAEPAQEAGARVAFARSGLVVTAAGGAWARMFPLFRLGLGGRLGNGRQYWSWISLRDEVAALLALIDGPLAGPVNLTGPTPATNAEVTAIMGLLMGRPTIAHAPAFALRAVLGEFSSEVLGSTRVLPMRLNEAGFTWQDRTIESAIRTALDKPALART